jgi:phosphodiesterase/alkaline phosphatase D-like protein
MSSRLNIRQLILRAALRRWKAASFGSVCAAGLLALSATPASALDTHAFSTSFGAASSIPANPYPLSGPASVAVDQTSHDTYVTDPTNAWVEKFDSSGNLILIFGKAVDKTKVEEAGSTEAEQNVCTIASGDICQPGAQGSGPGAFTTPRFIAVDNSSSASVGDVYVADTGTNLVQKFDAAGNLLTTWGGSPAPGQLDGSTDTKEHGPFGSLAGMAVDTSGSLFVYQARFFSSSPGGFMFKFAQDGSFTTDFQPPFGNKPAGIAVDFADNIYIVGPTVFSGDVFKLDSSGNAVGQGAVTNGANTTGLASDLSTGDLYIDNGGGHIDHYGPSCDPATQPCTAADSFGSGHLSGAAGLAVDSASHIVYAADTGDAQISAFAPAVLPDVTTGSVSNRQPTSATVDGHVDPAGGGEIIDCRFQYVTDAAFQATGYSDLSSGGTAHCSPETPYSSATDVSANLTGLAPLTTYHFRLVAANASGQNEGADQSFTTPSTPLIDGVSVSALTSTAVTLNAQINPNFADTTYHFEYGTGIAYGTSLPVPDADLGAGSTDQQASQLIQGLQPNTLYHYRVVAHNSAGTTPGVDHTFVTLPNTPSVTTGAASGVGQSTGTLNGTIDPHGAETSYYFEYSGPGIFSIITGKAGSGNGATTVTAPVSGLSPRATYQYRLIATNAGGTTFGANQTFTTAPPPPAGPPVVMTGGIANLTSGAVTVNGTVDPNGGATNYQFQYGASAAYGASAPAPEASAGSGAEPEGVVAGLSGLAPGTTYHYRLAATNAVGASYGADQTFTTAASPDSVFGPSPTNTIMPSTSVATNMTSKPLTRVQQLARALKACKRDKRKFKRTKCEKEARKKYGTKARKKK